MTQYFVVAALLAGCMGESPDRRPPTIDYIAAAILAPSCGRVACHASGTAQKGYTFDTVAASKASIMEQAAAAPGDPGNSTLYIVITEDGDKRMPPDGPLPEADIALIRSWIELGAIGGTP